MESCGVADNSVYMSLRLTLTLTLAHSVRVMQNTKDEKKPNLMEFDAWSDNSIAIYLSNTLCYLIVLICAYFLIFSPDTINTISF